MARPRDKRDDAHDSNRNIKDGLLLIWNELNNGQQNKLLKNSDISAMLRKYRIIE